MSAVDLAPAENAAEIAAKIAAVQTAAEIAAVKSGLAAETLRSFGPLRLPAMGWSMLPAIRPGDALVVEPISPKQVRVGDVVVIGRDGTLVAHRVVSTPGVAEEPRWIAQGDALPLPDRPVRASELLGRVAYAMRKGKRVELPAKLSAGERLVAKTIRRSVPAMRALVYLRSLMRSMIQTPKESIPPCRG